MTASLLRRHQTLSRHQRGIDHRVFKQPPTIPVIWTCRATPLSPAMRIELVASVKAAINIIREATYSFSQSSIQSNRTVDENFIYEGSFQPITGDPFWHRPSEEVQHQCQTARSASTCGLGRGRRFEGQRRRPTGSSKPTRAVLWWISRQRTQASPRKTSPSATDAARDAVVGYIRGESRLQSGQLEAGRRLPLDADHGGNPLGLLRRYPGHQQPDCLHTSTATSHRPRIQVPIPGRVITVGANDGQLHAFKTSDGSEAWSFIPPNLLSRLKLIAHATHPTSLTHQYLRRRPGYGRRRVDPRVRASSGTIEIGRRLAHADGLRGGAGRRRQSLELLHVTAIPASIRRIPSTYPYYCGYYALDLTSSLSPTFKWRLGSVLRPGALHGRTLEQDDDRPGAGSAATKNGSASSAAGSMRPSATDSGKGFFVVDLRRRHRPVELHPGEQFGSGQPHAGAARHRRYGQRRVHRYGLHRRHRRQHVEVQVLQEGGRRFLHHVQLDGRSLFSRQPLHPASDRSTRWRPWPRTATGNFWVYWGTGDKTDPTAANAQEKIFAVKDTDLTSTRTGRDVQNISSEGSVYNDEQQIRLLHQPVGTGREDAVGRDGLRRGALRDHLHARTEQRIPACRAGRRSCTASISRRAPGRLRPRASPTHPAAWISERGSPPLRSFR